VFSEDEYHAEYSDPYKWSNMTQMSLLGRYPGLFVGLSLEDPNIRRLIDVTHRQYPENANYAILPRKNRLKGQTDGNDAVMRIPVIVNAGSGIVNTPSERSDDSCLSPVLQGAGVGVGPPSEWPG
jgi:hypothetical protein